MLTPCYVPVLLDSSGICSNVPSKSVVLCLQVPLDPEILYISHALLVKMFDWGFQFLEWAFVFFPPSRVPFREKKDVNNELTKGGLSTINLIMNACDPVSYQHENIDI